jgi:GTPase
MARPIVAIVGRPNVGKSTLFNRIVGARLAVVDDTSGVTRDRNYAEAAWADIDFGLIDTGGVLPPSSDSMAEQVRTQAELAIAEADAIILLVDVKSGTTDLDLFIGRYLQRHASERVVVAANKAESPAAAYEAGRFMELGLGEPVPVSALHGTGVGDLLDRTCAVIGTRTGDQPSDEQALKLAILGRPNAGKSSLVNRLLGSTRMIVHDMPGTTRDAIDSHLTYHRRPITLIDTAGLRKRSHVSDRVEHYANLRAIDTVQRADVCILMVDAALGIGEQDVRILRHIEEAHRGIVLCMNKWDLVPKDHKTFDQLVRELRHRYMQLRHIPIIAASALTGQRVPVVIETALKVWERLHKRIPGGQFRQALEAWTTKTPPPMASGKQVKIMGGKQAQADHPVFLIFTANHNLVKPAYQRFLVNNIQETFGFTGCPVSVVFKPPAAPSRARRPRRPEQKEYPE